MGDGYDNGGDYGDENGGGYGSDWLSKWFRLLIIRVDLISDYLILS